MTSALHIDQVFDSRASLPPAIGVSASAIVLFGLHATVWGLALLLASLTLALFISKPLFQDLLLIGLGLTILASTSVRADIRWGPYFVIGLALGGALVAPLLVDRLVYKRQVITFPWRTGRKWQRWQWLYLVIVPLLAYLILPFYFIRSGSYQNWPSIGTASEYARFAAAVIAVGVWDELFFICVCFGLLRRHFPTWQANLLQATIFVSVLWELGYRSWGPFITFPFALVQAYLFTKTRSLTYVVIVHLIFDAVVFLVVVHAHTPGVFPIFIFY